MRNKIQIAFALLLLMACQTPEQALKNAESSISGERMKEYILELGSDAYQGRKPFSQGEKLSIDYLKKCFQEIGLEPANGNSYFQKVPLVMVNGKVGTPLNITTPNTTLSFEYGHDFVAFSRQMTPELQVQDSELVFAGYGIVAPEYNWNDYAELDVAGKTVVVLVNDPGLDSGRQDFFTGDAMTYYGRWSYKYEEAARQGAEAVFIIHDDKGAGYPWSVVVNSAAVAKVYPETDDNYMNRCKIEGWIHQSQAKELFAAMDLNLDQIIEEAKKNTYQGFEMKAKAKLKLNNSWHKDVSHNVMGMIRGTDLADEYLFYSAHWDHLGIGKTIDGDSIYNGAVDNGTSLAWMMEIAHAFKAMPQTPRRSVVFFAPTAEESGLNGSGYYADHPIFPIRKTVANINNDLMLPFGRCKDVMVTGYGKSSLDDILLQEAQKQDRYILPDPNAHTGMYYRSDHFSFARVGVPALFARGNNHHREKGKEYMAEREQYWINNCYHKPDDEYQDWWDLSGVEEDAKLLFRVGWHIANSDEYPQWKEGSEFKAIRDRQFD
ncbi:M28 family metallopeptidase [Carboxylicivirga sp. M1479]|uniref:M28 family metallopeptidase n=1 Tax=Carboxylicivirga sp. M1479 TaxID=2594476 RepID=UPI0011781F86|nr:M28 family metallopeptidase [Carboxylicivirga sp. M1479]TRX66549.1 M28 family peptidase [Carboxylicivirga sp. M1479]